MRGHYTDQDVKKRIAAPSLSPETPNHHYDLVVNEHGFIELISGRYRGPAAAMARFGLWCLSPFYSAGVQLRNASYEFGIKSSHRADVPVISVGNITTGGTGKTPVVACIANWLVSQNRNPCLLSRGYRAIDESGNDEKRLLGRLCPGVPHIQNPDRVAASQQAVTDFSADVLVLDDGFQHRRMGRDLNIVVIDATNPFGFDFVLPRGLLREPAANLKRADLILLTRCDQVEAKELDQTKATLQRYKKPIVEIVFQSTQLVQVDGSTIGLSSIENTNVGAFCGIGNPGGFRNTLTTLGVDPVFFHAFPDHSHYDSVQRQQLVSLAGQHETRTLVCTEKDLVKFGEQLPDVTILGVRIEAVFTQGWKDLETALRAVLGD